jgi:acetoin utilization deacetylase AcuC-like enzyme
MSSRMFAAAFVAESVSIVSSYITQFAIQRNRMLILSSDQFAHHITPPGHPERVERAHVFDEVAARWRDAGGRVESPLPADPVDLMRVHSPRYVAELATVARGPAQLDADTFTSPGSYDAALLASGAAVQAALHVLDDGESCLALVRPPGHHAERDHAMGFCLLNNVAVAAAASIARGLKRIAIVDVDVHHGNGTQRMFFDDPRVLYVSTHQYPFYPGTGAAEEVGSGAGRGLTVNVPMEAGANDADYACVYDRAVLPVLRAFNPELLIVCGIRC